MEKEKNFRDFCEKAVTDDFLDKKIRATATTATTATTETTETTETEETPGIEITYIKNDSKAGPNDKVDEVWKILEELIGHITEVLNDNGCECDNYISFLCKSASPDFDNILAGFNNFVWNLDKELLNENKDLLNGAILPTHIYFPDKNNTKRACVIKATKGSDDWSIKELKKKGVEFEWINLEIDWKYLAGIKKEDIGAVKKHHFQSLDFNRIMSGGKTNILFIPSSYTTTCRTGLLIPYNLEKPDEYTIEKEIAMIADLRRLISPYSAVIEMQLFIGQEKYLFFRADPRTDDIAKRFSVWMNANPELDDLTKSYQFISFYFPAHNHKRIGLIHDNDQYYYHACDKEGNAYKDEFLTTVRKIDNESTSEGTNDDIVIKAITSNNDNCHGENIDTFKRKYSCLYAVPRIDSCSPTPLYGNGNLSYSFCEITGKNRCKGFLFYRTRQGIKTLVPVAVIFIRSKSEIKVTGDAEFSGKSDETQKVTGEKLWHCLLKYFFLANDDSKLDCRQWLKDLAESYRQNKAEEKSGWHPNNFSEGDDATLKKDFKKYTGFDLSDINETKALSFWRDSCNFNDTYIKKKSNSDKISVENAVKFLNAIKGHDKYTFEAAGNEQFFFPFFGEHHYGFEYALALVEFLDALANEISKKKEKTPVVTLSAAGTSCSIKISADFFNKGAKEFVKKMRCQYWLRHDGCSRKFHNLVYVKYDQWQDAPNCEYRVDNNKNLIISWQEG